MKAQQIMDESYWAKVYAGQIAAAYIVATDHGAISWVEIAKEARALAKEMCKEGGE
jgi:hypothetical protein